MVERVTDDIRASDRLVSRLRDALPSLVVDQPVRLVYLFGSATTGLTTPFSDVDVGLVVDEGLEPLGRLRLVLRLQVDLHDCCDIPNAEVRVINDAPLVFRGRVVSDGILLYAREEQDRIEFETVTRLHYFDYLPIHKQLQQAFFDSIRDRGLYG